MAIIVFLHVPKNAGTTLRERYVNNDRFCMVNGEPFKKDKWHLDVPPQVVFGHTAQIGIMEQYYPNEEIIYVTSLRDPAERVMSQYNFWKTQVKYMRPEFNGNMDFYVWFTNKDIIRPMRHVKQYEHYYLNHVDYYKFLEQGKIVNDYSLHDIYQNSVLWWDGVKTTINNEYLDELQKRNDEIEEKNCNFAIDIMEEKVDYVMFPEDADFVRQFDTLMLQYDIQMETANIERTNETNLTMKKQNIEYTKLEDLSESDQQMVISSLQYEYKFYNNFYDE